MTLEQTSRLVVWVIVGLIALGVLLYFFGPAELRADEIIVICFMIAGLVWLGYWLRSRAK